MTITNGDVVYLTAAVEAHDGTTLEPSSTGRGHVIGWRGPDALVVFDGPEPTYADVPLKALKKIEINRRRP